MKKKQVTYAIPEQEGETLETIWTVGVQKSSEPMMTVAQANGTYNHPGYNRRRAETMDEGSKGFPHLKSHEQELYLLQNFYQTDTLISGGLGASGQSPYKLTEESMMQSMHNRDDGLFTQAIKNLSNNLAIQYTQPSPNEKVPKFDGDYTKWNAFWQAFTVLVDRNPKLRKITKLNRLNWLKVKRIRSYRCSSSMKNLMNWPS